MDINGAKALKERLGLTRTRKAPPAPAQVEVSEDAPPVYHWLGVGQRDGETPSAEADDHEIPGASLFQRLAQNFR